MAIGYCRCLRLCVCQFVCQSLACPRDNSGPVQARITKFGPKMQKTLVKVPIVLGGNWPWPPRSNVPRNLPHFELVRTITHYPFKLGSPNLGQRCKIAWLRSLLFWVAIDLDLQGQIWLKKSNFLVSPLLEIHNHQRAMSTWTASQAWLFHGLHLLHILIPKLFLDCFTVSTRCTYVDLGSRGYFGVYRRSCYQYWLPGNFNLSMDE